MSPWSICGCVCGGGLWIREASMSDDGCEIFNHFFVISLNHYVANCCADTWLTVTAELKELESHCAKTVSGQWLCLSSASARLLSVKYSLLFEPCVVHEYSVLSCLLTFMPERWCCFFCVTRYVRVWQVCVCQNSVELCLCPRKAKVVLHGSPWPTYYISNIDQHCCQSSSLFFGFLRARWRFSFSRVIQFETLSRQSFFLFNFLKFFV